MQDIPGEWLIIVKFLQKYTPIISSQAVRWKFPVKVQCKCSSGGASKGNPDTSACSFCIRNSKGELIC